MPIDVSKCVSFRSASHGHKIDVTLFEGLLGACVLPSVSSSLHGPMRCHVCIGR